MKRITALLLIAVMILLCGCNNEPEKTEPTTQEPARRSDVLYLDDMNKNYLACLDRYQAVVSAMKSKVQTLEEEHNKSVKAESSDKFFLEENYIQTFFEPFGFSYLSLTEKFETGMNNQKAQDEFASYSEGMKIDYYSNNANGNVLKFVSEGTVKTLETKYKKADDSLQYVYKTEVSGIESVTEKLEFITVSKNTYAIQSTAARCFIEFDKEGNIVYFCCVELREGSFEAQESIFNTTASIDRNWINTESTDAYSKIHIYENGELTHSECTSGPWKTVTINAADYDSAFIG